MNRILLLVFFLLYKSLLAQDDANTFIFKVRNAGSEVFVDQEDTVLYTDHNNRLRINVEGNNKLGPIQLEGGKIIKKDNYYIATVDEGTEAVLIVYLIKPNGILELGISKKIPIVHLKNPVPYIAGVKPDSIIARNDLLEQDKFYAKLDRFNSTKYLDIVSFTQVISKDTLVDSLVALSGVFTPAMRRYVQSLKPGIPLYFTNIICRMPSGEYRNLGDARFFVDCALPYSVGKR